MCSVLVRQGREIGGMIRWGVAVSITPQPGVTTHEQQQDTTDATDFGGIWLTIWRYFLHKVLEDFILCRKKTTTEQNSSSHHSETIPISAILILSYSETTKDDSSMLESVGHACINTRSTVPRLLRRSRLAHGTMDGVYSRPSKYCWSKETSTKSTSLVEQIDGPITSHNPIFGVHKHPWRPETCEYYVHTLYLDFERQYCLKGVCLGLDIEGAKFRRLGKDKMHIFPNHIILYSEPPDNIWVNSAFYNKNGWGHRSLCQNKLGLIQSTIER